MSAIVAIAAFAAAAVTSEHEEDTWVSLTSTDLNAREIIFAKLRGALKRGYRLAAVVIVLARQVWSLARFTFSLCQPVRRVVRLRLVRGRPWRLDLAPASLDMEGSVFDHGQLDSSQCLRPGDCQHELSGRLSSPGLAGVHPV